jgi:hypothetical protein
MTICGKVCEVYSRVVGYHRPIKNWNKGKQAEFAERLEYSTRRIKNGPGKSGKMHDSTGKQEVQQ